MTLTPQSFYTMNMFRKSSSILCGIYFFIFLLFGCSIGPEGYGVLLLSPNEAVIETGSLLTIEKSSSLHETSTVTADEGSEKIEIDRWRIEFFDRKEKAEEFYKAYAEYRTVFAENLKDGLAVRKEAEVSSQRVYKLREGQELKVLGRSGEEVSVGANNGYWYRVLTRDGVQGYCFDHYLDLFDAQAAPSEDEGPDLSKVRRVLSRIYRPIDYEMMREQGHIKLEKFTSQYGFFPDPEENQLRVETFDFSHEFSYKELQKQNERSYLFTGAGLELRIEDDTHITLIYTKDDVNYAPGFVIVENIDEIRQEERKRRKELLDRLVQSGPVFSSNAYGELSFSESGNFRWERFDRLVPRIIPSSDYREGTVFFDHFLGEETAGGYDGALRLDFTAPQGPGIVFLYRLEGEKLSFEYVSEKDIEDKVVLQRNASPLIVVFFSET